MSTFTFSKRGGGWYLNLPPALKEYNQTDFTYVEDANGALDEVASGHSELALNVGLRPIKEAAVLELETGDTGSVDGYYRLRNKEGVVLKHRLPLTELSLLLFGELPERIYLRRKEVPAQELSLP